MDLNIIIQAIGSVGFPIFACLYMVKTNEDQDKRHREEIDSLRAVIEANTLTVQRLADKIDSIAAQGGDPKK